MTDTQCILELAAGSTAEAFADIVRRYAALVYSTARRLVRDEHLAEDVTQATFVVLIKKAREVDPRYLPGWLVNTTRLTAKAALRSEGRREKRERSVASMRPVVDDAADGLNIGEITPILDQALSHLKEIDRTAVVMRFFQGQSFSQIASTIGTSEEAARKKVARSLEKMRGVFMRRGFVPSVGGLVVALASHQAKAAPVAVIKSIVSSPLPASSSSSAILAKGVVATMKWTKVKVASLVLIGLSAVFGSGQLLRQYLQPEARIVTPITRPVAEHPILPPASEPVEDTSKYAARVAVFTGAGKLNLHNAKGWPLQLPGEVCSTPVVADLLGDGHLEIIASCRATGDPIKGITDGEPLLFAFRADGTTLPGWPIAVQENDPHKAQSFEWMSSPSVFRRDGKDELVMVGAHAGVIVVKGDGSMRRISADGKNWHDNIPLADLDGDGIPDIAIGKFIANVDGKHVKGWPPARRLRDGFSSCVGDAFGDGKLEVFHPSFNGDIEGVDSHGIPLPGWPHSGSNATGFPPVMGDVLGNGQSQIIYGSSQGVQAWNPDGSPLRMTFEIPSQTVGGAGRSLIAALRLGAALWSASPSLADLDGSGKADIIAFDHSTGAIRAWHGDGKSVYVNPREPDEDKVLIKVGDQLSVHALSDFDDVIVDSEGNIRFGNYGSFKAAGLTTKQLGENLAKGIKDGRFQNVRVYVSVYHPHLQLDLKPMAATQPVKQGDELADFSEETAPWRVDEGMVAVLPSHNVRGVSVVSLGDDPRRMDFFAGSYWVDRRPDGSTDVIEMVPGNPRMASVQPTVADVERNGMADVIFGTEDGLLYVYQTKLAYHADRMQWPTANGNFQHTGAWHRIDK